MQQAHRHYYTYEDYCSWNDGERYELIDGEVYMMAPGPSVVHQRISGGLFFRLYNHLLGKTCEVFAAPFDVRLNADTEDDTVVQPDLIVVCDPSKISKQGCKGAPDMVVEILSPGTVVRDRHTKFRKYRDAGVTEYWIVDPDARVVTAHLLKNGEYIGKTYFETDTVAVHVLEDCRISLADVFPPAPPEEELKKPGL